MLDEAERPEQGTTHEHCPPSIRHFLSQPIRSGVCHHPTEIGNCDQQRCMACHYFLGAQKGQ